MKTLIISLLSLLTYSLSAQNFPEYIHSVSSEMKAIPEERKAEIEKLSIYVRRQIQTKKPVNLVFICTHNSRRSQMSQIWASIAAEYFQLHKKIKTYSGGTENTAFNPRAVAALERAGVKIEKQSEETNPHYLVHYSKTLPAIECFSKVYTNPSNPQKNFVAVMNCSDADKNCPNVVGAAFRTAIKYDDPKLSDGTPEEQKTYDERCRQIATEMFYLMSLISSK